VSRQGDVCQSATLIFSIGPLIVIVIAIAGLAFGAEAVQRDVAA
jgi:hypothetical protein